MAQVLLSCLSGLTKQAVTIGGSNIVYAIRGLPRFFLICKKLYHSSDACL